MLFFFSEIGNLSSGSSYNAIYWMVRPKASSLQITAITFCSASDYPATALSIFTRPGSFSGYESNSAGWERIHFASLGPISSFNGDRSRTVRIDLPSPVAVRFGEELSFLLHTDHSSAVIYGPNELTLENDDMEIIPGLFLSSSASLLLSRQRLLLFVVSWPFFVGPITTSSTPFESVSQPGRRFVGALEYNILRGGSASKKNAIDRSRIRALPLSEVKGQVSFRYLSLICLYLLLSSASDIFLELTLLKYSGTTTQNGYCFSVKNKTDRAILIKSLEWPNGCRSNELSYRIFMRSGSFRNNESNQKGWSVVASNTAPTQSFDGYGSKLQITLFTRPVVIAAGGEVSFYIHSSNSNGVACARNDHSDPTVDVQDDNLSITGGYRSTGSFFFLAVISFDAPRCPLLFAPLSLLIQPI